MAFTSSNMGLKVWDQPNDIFSYTDLVANWVALDSHDHSSGKGVQIGNAGIANLAIDSTKIADSAVTNAKLAGSIADSKLASPLGGAYRVLARATAAFVGMSSGINYLPTQRGDFTANGSPSATPPSYPTWNWNAASYAVAGKTTKLRLCVNVQTNAIAPGNPFNVGYAPVTAVGGAASQASLTVGAFALSNSLTFPANTFNTIVGTDQTPPADGLYSFFVNIGAAQAANSVLGVTFELQLHYV